MFDAEEIFLPEVVIAADAMKAVSKIFIPACQTSSKTCKMGKVIIGTVEGDVHDVGKCIVAAMLESAGFEVVDLGRDVLLKKFIDKAKEIQPDIIGVSALMTATRIGQKTIIDMLIKENLKNKVKVMIGGAATSGEWAQQIGADAWGENAPDAIRKAIKLVSKQN